MLMNNDPAQPFHILRYPDTESGVIKKIIRTGFQEAFIHIFIQGIPFI
jgi:hypothetical protein